MSLNISTDFFSPVDKSFILDESGYENTQYALSLLFYPNNLSEIENADIILLGCNENRGSQYIKNAAIHTQNIRQEFYRLYNWHKDLKIVDLGNIQLGENLQDTYVGIQHVIGELVHHCKKILLFGGSPDLTKALYPIFRQVQQNTNIVYTHASLPFENNKFIPEMQFMYDLLTDQPTHDCIQYTHLAFQSYLVHPQLMEILDTYKADLFRLGIVHERLEEMEPLLRIAHIISLNIKAIKPFYYSMNHPSPHGLSSEHACRLMQFAGMSMHNNITHICGYDGNIDKENFYAMLVAQMIWYFIDGYARTYHEVYPNLANIEESFNTFEIEIDKQILIFLQNLRTNRWWMQSPKGKYIPCVYEDYLTASQNNEIPERWIRNVEKD